jgi:hypothetical protein
MARPIGASALALMMALSVATTTAAQPYRHGHRPNAGWRGGHRHHRGGGNGGALVAAGIGGLILGTALANANRYDPPPAPVPYAQVDNYVEPYRGHDWANYCSAKYSTYNTATGEYMAADGRTYPCH